MGQKLQRQVRRLYNDERSKYAPRTKSVIINWGLSSYPEWYKKFDGLPCNIINHFNSVEIASNKLETFNCLHGNTDIPIPKYTTDRSTALEWVNEGILVVGRTKLNGHSGAGIVLAARAEDLPENCPLFVQYIKKLHEYRVHVAFGKVIDVQHKRKRSDFSGTIDYAVRNHSTGWVYCREDLVRSERMEQIARDSVQVLGLSFGAVDIIYNKHHDSYYVLEVNTAPGLEGQTVENYAQAFYEALK